MINWNERVLLKFFRPILQITATSNLNLVFGQKKPPEHPCLLNKPLQPFVCHFMNVDKLPTTAQPMGNVRISAAAEMNNEGFLWEIFVFLSPQSSSVSPRFPYAFRQTGYGR